ncbi:hypothetical protein LOAG_10518, partial [Loa loa]
IQIHESRPDRQQPLTLYNAMLAGHEIPTSHSSERTTEAAAEMSINRGKILLMWSNDSAEHSLFLITQLTVGVPLVRKFCYLPIKASTATISQLLPLPPSHISFRSLTKVY